MKIQLFNHLVNKMETRNAIETSSNRIKIIRPQYFFTEEVSISVNQYLKITHNSKLICTSCDKPTKKLYSGFCYLCLTRKPEADLCIMSPDRCHFSSGTCRSSQFAEAFCFQPHYLYLAFTDKYKVGLTRHTQIPTRWIDQGATLASEFLKVHSRHQAGIIEKFLTQKLADKSHWKNMLKAQNQHTTISDFQNELALVKNWLKETSAWENKELHVKTPQHLNIAEEIAFVEENDLTEVVYPFSQSLPDKIQSIRLAKSPTIEGKVIGIKGQYIILENGNVINIRSHSGYVVDIEIEGK